MKIMKKISAVLLAIMLCVPCISMVAHAADAEISFTDPETAVGEMVEIKCAVRAVSELGDIEIKLSYDSESLRFDSGDGVTADGDGSLTYTGSGSGSEATFTMKFQALKEGSTTVSIASANVTSSYGSTMSLEEGSSAVTIAAGDPSKIQQTSATPSAGDMQVEVNGETYTLTDNFADADIPSGYSKTTVTLEGQDRQMVVNETDTVYLGYLVNTQNEGDFFIYNDDDATFSPYEEISISDSTSIIVLSDTSKVKLPDTYQEGELTLNEKQFPMWRESGDERYCILYAMNNNGDTGYYQYDTEEETFQRVEISADTEEESDSGDNSLLGRLKNFINGHLQLLIIIAGIGGLIILILIIVLAVKLRNRNLELDDLYDEYGIDLDEEEPAPKNDKKSKKSKGGRGKYDEDDFDEIGFEDDFDEDDFEDDFDEDDFDEDDFDEDNFDEDDFDEDIFAEEKLGKYDTMNVRRGAPIGGIADEDDLDELLGNVPKKDRSDKEDAFKVDFIDLD